MAQNETWLAHVFNSAREIIEAAETPFAKLVTFLLPILAPLVPSTITALHLYQLFMVIFRISELREISFILSILPGFASIMSGIVLEMLGYVGAIFSVRAIFRWIKEKTEEYLVPAALNLIAYMFYLVSMWLINVALGNYFGSPEIVTQVVGLLAFITVPTSLLVANHLAMKELEERDERLRKQKQEFRLEKLKIERSGGLDGFGGTRKVSGKFPEHLRKFQKIVESFQKVSGDWRKLYPELSVEDLNCLATMSPSEILALSNYLGVTDKTITNWRIRARKITEGKN